MRFAPMSTLFWVILVGFAPAASGDRSPGEPRQGLYVVDPTSPSPKLLVPGERDDPAWSPDGRWLVSYDAAAYGVNLDVVDSAGANRHRVGSIRWSHRGSLVAYTNAKTRTLSIGSSDWRVTRLVEPRAGSDPIAWSPDDHRLLYGSGRSGGTWSGLATVDANGAHRRKILAHSVVSASWSPDGKALAIMDFPQHLGVMASAGGKLRRLPGTWEGWPYPDWSLDGRSLIVYPAQAVSSTGGFDAVQLLVTSGARRVLCKQCPAFVFSPDGQSIAFTDATNTLWLEKGDGTGKRRVAKPVFTPSWSPDSHSLVFSIPDADGVHASVAIADATTGAVRKLTDGTHSDRPLGGVSADGTFVAFERFLGESAGQELWIVGADGTGAHRIMAFGTCSLAAWSPAHPLLAVTNLDDC